MSRLRSQPGQGASLEANDLVLPGSRVPSVQWECGLEDTDKCEVLMTLLFFSFVFSFLISMTLISLLALL